MEAKFHASKGLDLSKELHSSNFMMCFHLLLSELELKCHNLDKSLDWFRLAGEIKAKVFVY